MVHFRAAENGKKMTTAHHARNTAFSKRPTKPPVRASFSAIMVSRRYTIAAPACISVLIVAFASIVLLHTVISVDTIRIQLNFGHMKEVAPGKVFDNKNCNVRNSYLTYFGRYIVCFGKERVERECSSGFFFNPRIGQCDRPENVDCTPDTSHLPSIECPKNNQVEFLPSLHACKSYFVCAAGRPSLHNCTRGLIFDIETNRCTTKGRCLLDYQPECTKNAEFLPHIYDCRHYYFCINDQPVLRACAPGLLFDIASLQCNLDPLATCAAPPRPSQPIWPNKKPARNIILWTSEF